MKFEVVTYNIKTHRFLDECIDESKYLNAKAINKYAAYNEPISDTYKYFLKNPFGMANIKSFIKLFVNEGVVYYIAVFHYYNEKQKFYLGINPIIVNPKFINQGIGTMILKQIIIQSEKITLGRVDNVKADTEATNIASIKMLEKVGFIKMGQTFYFC